MSIITHWLSDGLAPEADLTFLLKCLVTLQRAGWIKEAYGYVFDQEIAKTIMVNRKILGAKFF